ncbi:mitogen-activated protein kinase kinase kinase 9-like [Orbicella faveolata]|uniref:mitogen-activated protein kinase kinase kinase 9-like n=1 Tax=Orbicella faveolata TaxID=48498 RepID=UPI0009E528A7|nr:mitogen-activated protein kinase kinase kinase 9-like [Orbicella faveolata]
MLTGKPPLGHLESAAAMFRIGSKPIEPTLPENVSLDANEFVKAALTWKPDERPWSDELQRYEFVSKALPTSFSLGECIGTGAFGQVQLYLSVILKLN